MSLEEEKEKQGDADIRKVHAFVLESSALVWDARGGLHLVSNFYKLYTGRCMKCNLDIWMQMWHIWEIDGVLLEVW